MSSQTGRTVSFQLSTSNVGDASMKNVREDGQGVYTQTLSPAVQVPFYAKPEVALWSLSFANTIANVDKTLYDNDTIVAGTVHLENNYTFHIPTGNYSLSDLEYEIAVQLKRNVSIWSEMNNAVRAVSVYFSPDANKSGSDANLRTVTLPGLADPAIAKQWSSIDNDAAPLTFTEIQGLVNQYGATVNERGPKAIHPEMGPVAGENASHTATPAADMTASLKRYVKPVTLRYNPQSNRIEFITVGLQITKDSTLFTKTLGFKAEGGSLPDYPTTSEPMNDAVVLDYKVWNAAQGWVTPATPIPPMVPAGTFLYVARTTPPTAEKAANIDNTRAVTLHLPRLAAGSYDRDGKESGAQVASVPIRAAPGDSESWEVTSPLFMPCRIAGSNLTEIKFYMRNETGQKIDLQGGHFEATIVLRWPAPVGEAPPPSSFAARTDLDRIIQPWAKAMAS